MLDPSMLDLSILDRVSAMEDDCEVLDVGDFQPFRIDLRALSFSFSGVGGGLAGGTGDGGTLARGSSANRVFGDGWVGVS